MTGIRGSYAAFRVTAKYTGPTIQIRRGFDSSILDFFANSEGSLGTLIDGKGTHLTDWLLGSNGYVKIWYDQSGQGRHATQNTESSQPIFDIVNKQIDFTAQAGQAYLNLPDGTVPQNIQYTVIVKHNNINAENGAWLNGGMADVYLGSNGFRRMSSSYRNWWWGNDADTGGYAPGNTVTYKYDGSSRTTYINGVQTSVTFSSSWNGATGYESIAFAISQGYMNGELYFLHIYATSLSDSDRKAVESGFLDVCYQGN